MKKHVCDDIDVYASFSNKLPNIMFNDDDDEGIYDRTYCDAIGVDFDLENEELQLFLSLFFTLLMVSRFFIILIYYLRLYYILQLY